MLTLYSRVADAILPLMPRCRYASYVFAFVVTVARCHEALLRSAATLPRHFSCYVTPDDADARPMMKCYQHQHRHQTLNKDIIAAPLSRREAQENPQNTITEELPPAVTYGAPLRRIRRLRVRAPLLLCHAAADCCCYVLRECYTTHQRHAAANEYAMPLAIESQARRCRHFDYLHAAAFFALLCARERDALRRFIPCRLCIGEQ